MPAENNNQSTLKQPERELVSWTAPARPFKRRDRQFYITVFAITAIVGLILFLAEGFMPVILIISLIFLFYVMNTVPPENVEYKISDRGVKIGGRLTEWGTLTRFWFTKRFDNELLVIEMTTLPGRLELVMEPGKKEEIKKALAGTIPEEEASPSFLDRTANWFSRRLPGNK